MKVVIITCMTCMFAVALTMGGPIRRQAFQSEKTVPIRGNVTLLCPFVPDVTWQYVYWKKNDQTIYSLEVKSNTPTTNDTRYEGSNHATRLTIKDLKKADSGIYHCKVATLATSDFIKEGGQLLLSVTDQEEGLFTTSPGVPFKTSTKIPPEPTEVKTIILSIIVSILLIIITLCLIFKYWKRITESKFMSTCRRLAPTGTASTSEPDAPNHDENEELQQESPAIISDPLMPPDSTTSSKLDSNSPSTPLLHSDTQTSETEEKQLPLVGPVLIDDLYNGDIYASASYDSVKKRLKKVVHSLVELFECALPGDGGYSESLNKYVRSGNRCVPPFVLEDVRYFLYQLDHISAGRKRDVCEILLTMPENLDVDTSLSYSNKDIFMKYDPDNQESAVKREHPEMTSQLKQQMRTILRKSKMRDAARNFISLIILGAPVGKLESASFSQQATSSFNRSVNMTEQETSFSSKRDEDLKREEHNLIEFWLSKVIKLDQAVQRRVSDQLDHFDHDADSSFKDNTMHRPDMQSDDEKEVKNTKHNERTDLSKESPAAFSSNQATGMKDEFPETCTKNIWNGRNEMNRRLPQLIVRSTKSTPWAPDVSNRVIRDEESSRTKLPSSDTHGRDDVDMDDKPEDNLYVLNDPIHSSVQMPKHCQIIIDTPEFQRLRFIKHLGCTSYVLPSAVHTRFEHSIGVSHLGGKLALMLQQNDRNSSVPIQNTDVACVEIAGLCHDLGHGPFSHAFEDIVPPDKDGKKWKHEEQSVIVLKYLIKHNSLEKKLEEHNIYAEDIDFICQLILGVNEGEEMLCENKFCLYQIVHNSVNGVDVDTWDYLARDNYYLGMKSAFDFNRILPFVKVLDVKRGSKTRGELCFRDKTASDLNQMFLTRRRLHYTVYQHIASRISTVMLKDAFQEAADHLIFLGEGGKEYSLLESVKDPEAFCQVNDTIVNEIMRSRSQEPGMLKAREIIGRIHRREFYHCIAESNHTIGKMGTVDPAEIKRSIVTNVDELSSSSSSSYSEIWQAHNIEVEVSRFDYGSGNKNPLLDIPFYKKIGDGKLDAMLLTEHELPAEQPQRLIDTNFRIYTKVPKLDRETINKARSRCKTKLEVILRRRHPVPTAPRTKSMPF